VLVTTIPFSWYLKVSSLDLMISASRRYQHPMQYTLAIRFDAGTREPADLVVEFRMFTEIVQRHGDVRQGRRRRDVNDEPLHVVKHNRSQVSRTPREWDSREARQRRDLKERSGLLERNRTALQQDSLIHKIARNCRRQSGGSFSK
jgi:hypothetical protein